MNRGLLLRGVLLTFNRFRLRSFFMGLGVVVGVAALVITRSMGEGAEQEMMERLQRLLNAGSIIVVNSGHVTRGGIRARGKLTLEDVQAIAGELETVVDWDPSVLTSEREVQYQGRNRSLRIVGESERAPFVWGRQADRGEYFTESDVRAASRVAMLGPRAAEALFEGEDPVGKSILIGGAPFRVLGVLEPHGLDPHGMDRDDEVHVPITTMMRRMLNTDTISSAKLILSDIEETEETVDRIAEILVARHGLSPEEPDDFSIFTPTQVQSAVRRANRVLTIYLPATAGVSLLVATVVIANLMLLGVRERIPEIGLRKAVGATSGQITGQFLLESLALTALAGMIGVGVGAAIVLTLAAHIASAATVTPDSIALGLGSALVVGLAAGVLPARRASRLEAVDALR